MTRYREKGDNEFTDAARREAARTGRDIGDILNEWLRQAKAAKDKARQRKLVKALKYLIFRNRQKRRGRS